MNGKWYVEPCVSGHLCVYDENSIYVMDVDVLLDKYSKMKAQADRIRAQVEKLRDAAEKDMTNPDEYYPYLTGQYKACEKVLRLLDGESDGE